MGPARPSKYGSYAPVFLDCRTPLVVYFSLVQSTTHDWSVEGLGAVPGGTLVAA